MFRDVLMSLEDDKSGVFSFSHSGAVLKFSSFLGLFKDEELSPLRYDGFLANANRTYRVVQLNLTRNFVSFIKPLIFVKNCRP